MHTAGIRRTLATARRSPGVPHHGGIMQVVVTHEVNDVGHWFNSPERSRFFEARGMKATAFRDPQGDGKTVAVLIETPDLATLGAALDTPEAKVAEKHDGVHVETIRLFVDE